MYTEERYKLGLPEMDTQHDYLYSLFDRIESASTVTNTSATKALLDEIERYVLFHFSSEEYLMRLYNVKSFAMHQSDHEQASNRLVRFMDDFEAGKLNPAALRIFLTGWLMEHSRSCDAGYVEEVRKVRESINNVS